jgi:hypothetical protein
VAGRHLLRAYEANRRAAIETVIEADPVAACVRDIMAVQTRWSGSASDLLRIGADPAENGMSPRDRAGRNLRARWPAGCVAPRQHCERWALRSRLAARGVPERGSSA